MTLLTEMTEALNNKREELLEEKKLADSKNEELKTLLNQYLQAGVN